MLRRTFLSTSAAGLSALALAACSDDAAETTDSAATPSASDVPSDREPPTVEVPEGDPPTELQITDLIEGTGDEATAGSLVSVHYTGVAWSTGEQFDSSWERGEPLQFPLGDGMVIPGWDEGIQGMRVGGRRQLIIPPDMAYGESGAGDVIGPNETLIFVCDLVAVQ